MNYFINTSPTRVATPYGRSAEGISSSTPDVVESGIIDPTTGLNMAKCTISAGSTTPSEIFYDSCPTITMSPNDVWILPVYLPEVVDEVFIQLTVSNLPHASSSSDYRVITFTSNSLQRGFNILKALHVETRIYSGTYNILGTGMYTKWYNGSNITDSACVNSISTKIKITATKAVDTEVYVGSVYTAPEGWAKGSIMWMADDVPSQWYDLALPVLESYGWKTTVAVTSTYATDPERPTGPPFMSLEQTKDMVVRGHEIWGHTRKHEDMDNYTTSAKFVGIKDAVSFWNAVGIPSAAKYMAWPFGRYDDESIQIAKDHGYKLCRNFGGHGFSPLAPAVNPYYLDATSVEKSNPWQVDAIINGSILRGSGMITFMHTPAPGGAGINTPNPPFFYIDHLKRWCDLVASHESMGRCIVTTPTEYFKLCGVDVDTDSFYEV